MVFSSLLFIYIFLPLCLLLYFIRNNTAWRNGILIVFSLIFYAWGEPVYVFLMVITVAVNWLGTRIMKRRKAVLVILLALNLGLLGVFKYAGLAVASLNALTGLELVVPALKLPIGISFYTFQILSYVVDVYRGEVAPQKSFARLLLYISLFPQLIAGPIVRYGHIAEEIGTRKANITEISAGLQRFLVGLAKKAILANTCGSIAAVQLDPKGFEQLSAFGAWFGIILYAMQIYFDFSAYSDMAIGMGRILGFHYRENFNYPYVAKSASEFWRRWHMSLGTFFRDYVYIPLGGNRRLAYRNLLIVWALTGLWHGASWNFVLWGLWYFVFIAIEKLWLRRVLERAPAVISHLYLILVVLLGWVLFYYTKIGDIAAFFPKLIGIGAGLSDPATELQFLNNMFFFILAIVACLPVLRYIKRLYGFLEGTSPQLSMILFVLKYAFLALLFVLSTILLAGNSYNPFIYFRF
jgi:alginate O-acetyltransferase complex protein AlgI